MDIREEIKKLVQLQELDTKLYALRNILEVEKPQELEKIKKDLEEKKKIFEKFDNEFKKIQVEKKNKEMDLATKEENLRKTQVQLYQVKTNKEYQMQLSVIESIKADISRIEDQILKIMEDLDRLDGVYKDKREELEKEEKAVKDREEKIKGEMKNIEKEIQTLLDKRNEFVTNIDKNILKQYEFLLKSRKGRAISSVENEHCSVCLIRVTAQKINEIKMYSNLVYCESCARILYIPEDL